MRFFLFPIVLADAEGGTWVSPWVQWWFSRQAHPGIARRNLNRCVFN